MVQAVNRRLKVKSDWGMVQAVNRRFNIKAAMA
jgi:hypothetical protein